MQKPIALLIILCCSAACVAQSITLNGILKDTTTKLPLKLATISLLKTKDSVLVKYTRANADGAFELKGIAPAAYILLINYPGYAEYADVIDVTKDENLGTLFLFTKAVALQNVIVRGSGSIRFRGDTIGYVADSFRVKEGASVEDLLKKLPGIQVNKKGEITAQGEKVEKILVDGEEFFGDDPTLATQNLNAASVKEVQVFDKKSDQAAFTGVDDGSKTKTINLKLKDDANKGYFGKVKLAGGLPNRWENSALFNRFRQKKKISAFGVMGNTGKTGLSWGEERQYGGSDNQGTFDEENGYFYYESNNNDGFGNGQNFNGQGLPTAFLGGVTYSNKWDVDNNNINGSYRYQKQRITGGTSTISQYILPDTQYFLNQRSQSITNKNIHKANLSYEIKLDSSQSLKFTATATEGQNLNNGTYYSEALSGKGLPVNNSNRQTNALAKTNTLNSSVLWKKKFKKARRTISVTVSENYNNANSDGFLLNYNQFYTDGLLFKKDTTDQKKTIENNGLTINSKVAYTEPLGKKGIVEINYAYNLNNSKATKLSFDKKNGKYENLNAIFSSNFQFNIKTHNVGLAYRFNDKKYNFGLGANVANAQWKQVDLFKDSTRNYNYTNFFPRANFQYKISQYSRISVNYNGNTTAPTLNQTQPIANNADPLNIYIGNPNLKQSFTQYFSVSYNDYKVLTEQNIYTSLSYSNTSKAFGSIDVIDSIGRKTYQTVNVDGNYRINYNVYSGIKLKKANIRLGLNSYGSINKNNGFVNGQKNTNTNSNASIDLSVSKDIEDKYDISFSTAVGYNISKSTIRPDVVTKYFTYEPSLDVNVELPWKLELNTDFNYSIRQKTSVFDNNNNVALWNASLEKKLSKKTGIILGLKVNDILNQNLGFSRVINSNYVTEQNYDVIKRFWLLTLTWNFNKGPKKEDEW